MGTNYYRVPTEAEMEKRKLRLETVIKNMDMSPGSIECGIPLKDDYPDSWDAHNPWTEFLNDASIHLGKRSGGWKFCWNFHENKHYSNKEELLAFIRSGRVVDEYGTVEDPEEFIAMALDWGQPDGLCVDAKYDDMQRKSGSHFWGPEHWDRNIDGLRVSSATNFS
jgi:hypothetical protein